MSNPSENMRLWNAVQSTDPSMTKHVRLGRYEFTTICQQYQTQCATKQWGPYGRDWGLKSLEWSYHPDTDGKIAICLDAVFAYPGGEFPISVDMPFSAGADCRKKLMTEAKSKSLSLLGYNADVFLGMFEDSRYVAEMKFQHAEESEIRELILAKIHDATANNLPGIIKRLKQRLEGGTISDVLHEDLMRECQRRAAELGVTDGADDHDTAGPKSDG